MQNEISELIAEELIEFFNSYLMMISLSSNGYSCFIDDQKLIGYATDDYLSVSFDKYQHFIKRTGRAKLTFNFNFPKEDIDHAIKLSRLLESYVEYNFTVKTFIECFNVKFEFDFCSKKRSIDFFERLIK